MIKLSLPYSKDSVYINPAFIVYMYPKPDKTTTLQTRDGSFVVTESVDVILKKMKDEGK